MSRLEKLSTLKYLSKINTLSTKSSRYRLYTDRCLKSFGRTELIISGSKAMLLLKRNVFCFVHMKESVVEGDRIAGSSIPVTLCGGLLMNIPSTLSLNILLSKETSGHSEPTRGGSASFNFSLQQPPWRAREVVRKELRDNLIQLEKNQEFRDN